MFQEYASCKEHKQVISHICIDQHDCSKRRLCLLCLATSHQQIAKENILPYEEFNNLAAEITIQKLSDDVSLVGPVCRGLKQGGYYYLFTNGAKQYAGQYELNCKQGHWKEYIGEQFQQQFERKVKLFIDTIYCDGQKQGVINSSDKKKGMWIESGGLENEIKMIGEYELDVRVGYWKIEYDETIIGGGTYDQKGLKQGYWLEPSKHYHQTCRISFSGGYKNGQRIGQWTIYYQKNQDKNYIGGGNYDNYGRKTGQWIDVHDNFSYCQVVYSGEYENDLRVGFWTILYKKKKIGGGQYGENEKKIGKWIDIHDSFSFYSPLTLSGEYRNNVRINTWNISISNQQIGGGKYDFNGLKQGRWTDVHEQFQNCCLMAFSGQYRNDERIGFWSISVAKIQIGGGNYENGIKQGDWIDLHKCFRQYGNFITLSNFQVTQRGLYNNGKQIGEWPIFYQNVQIGGGKYDDNGIMQGSWTELLDNSLSQNCICSSGEYSKGEKIGQWSTYYNNVLIGEGNYDDNGRKSGNWTEIHPNFDKYMTFQIISQCQVTFTGKYICGEQIGQWKTYLDKIQIGGGDYDCNGRKQGNWIDLNKYFQKYRQVTLSGEYRNGKRIGLWSAYLCQNEIGGGNYDDNGRKQGNWVDLTNFFCGSRQVTFRGEYQNGVRIGQWTIYYMKNKIGGGNYNNYGLKQGNWCDVHDHFSDICQVVFSGKYENGIKFGPWATTFQNDLIGGGNYDNKGMKQRTWTDLHPQFSSSCPKALSGEYIDGLRNGQWAEYWVNSGQSIQISKYEFFGLENKEMSSIIN